MQLFRKEKSWAVAFVQGTAFEDLWVSGTPKGCHRIRRYHQVYLQHVQDAPVINGIHIPLPPNSWELQTTVEFLPQGTLSLKAVINILTSEGILSLLRLGSLGRPSVFIFYYSHTLW